MSWSKGATERRYIWPYLVHENKIKAHTRCVVFKDGNEIRRWENDNYLMIGDYIADNHACWDVFSEINSGWDYIDVELSVSNDTIYGLAETDNNPVLTFSVYSICPITRWRHAEVASINGESTRISFRIRHEDVAGEIIIYSFFLMKDNAETAALTRPKFKGSRIVTAYPVLVNVDEPEERVGRGVAVQWQEFPEHYKDALYRLEPPAAGTPKPTIYINSRHPQLKDIINSRARHGNKARIRDAVFSVIASDIWMQLLEYAVRIERESGDEDDNPEVVLSKKIRHTVSKKAKLSSEIIDACLENEGTRRDVKVKIQHWMKIAVRQVEMISEVRPSDEGVE